MAYEFTFTPRFQKHFKGLTAQEKKLLKNKLELLATRHGPCGHNADVRPM